jgi:hypothetical protein
MKATVLQKDIYTIENFWTPAHCDEFIAATEAMGYDNATIQTDHGPRLVEHIRNNQRVIRDDVVLADSIWNVLKDFIPQYHGDSLAIGLNERFRFYRYSPGQRFKKHRDQSYIRNSREASYFTFMIYLNDNFTGGATTFNNLVVSPKKGMALIFYHYLEHEGAEVTEGTKYVLRTDIMYRLNNIQP